MNKIIPKEKFVSSSTKKINRSFQLIGGLCTESFTLEEVNLLLDVLNNKWDLKCYKNKKGTNLAGYRIIIPSYSIPRLQTLLEPQMPTMMRHKIGL